MTDFGVGFRREPPPDPDAVGEDAVLVDAIRQEIAGRGPMTFARFMDLALYAADHGYYRQPDRGPGGPGRPRTGDFLTAPESTPVFGMTLARVLAEAWDRLGRPSPFVVREHGAGAGALEEAVMHGLAIAGSPLLEALRYEPVDVDRPPATTGAWAGVLLANELLDALPVHRVVQRAGRLRERFVTMDGDGFVEVEGDPSQDALARHLELDGVTLADGQRTEVPLAADDWLPEAARELTRGIVLLLDYGAEARDLHGPARPEGSLRTFARQTVGRDPFTRIGRQDLTTHVCLAGIRRGAATAGLETLGETTQAEFLVAAGAGDVVRARQAAPDARLADALLDRSALARLLDPRKLGGYHVLAFGRALPAGFALEALARVKPPWTG